MKRAFLLLAFLCLSLPLLAQGGAPAALPVVTNGVGQPLQAFVAICTSDPGPNPTSICNTLATIYTGITLATQCTGPAGTLPLNNRANPLVGTGCSNPGLTDGFGNVLAFATPGVYYCEFYGPNIVGFSSQPCIFPGTSGGGGGGGTGCVVNPSDNGCALAGTPTIDLFIGTVGPGTGWLEQLTASQKTIKVPLQIQSAGSSNVIFGSDSGSSAQTNGSSNTFQLGSGSAPGTQLTPVGGSFLPIWAANVSGVTYSTVLEMQANQGVTYPSLVNGNIPIAQLIQSAGVAGCTSANFIKGDLSGCASSSSSPAFSAITTATNSTAHMTVGNGGILDTDGAGGIVNANQVNGTVYPPAAATACGLGVADRVVLTNAANSLCATSIPNTVGSNFLQYNTTTHAFAAGAPSGTIPVVIVPCNGVSGTCPNTSAYTVNGTDLIMASYTLPANTLATGKCVVIEMWWEKNTTGATASITYKWNLGGTGAVNTTVAGGQNTPGSSTSGNSNIYIWKLNLCNNSGVANYARAEQLQAGSATLAGVISQNTYTFSSDLQINLTFNGTNGNADTVTFDGGMVNFP